MQAAQGGAGEETGQFRWEPRGEFGGAGRSGEGRGESSGWRVVLEGAEKRVLGGK